MASEDDFVVLGLQGNEEKKGDTTTDHHPDADMVNTSDKTTFAPAKITQTQTQDDHQFDADTEDERENDDEKNGKLLFL